MSIKSSRPRIFASDVAIAQPARFVNWPQLCGRTSLSGPCPRGQPVGLGCGCVCCIAAAGANARGQGRPSRPAASQPFHCGNSDRLGDTGGVLFKAPWMICRVLTVRGRTIQRANATYRIGEVALVLRVHCDPIADETSDSRTYESASQGLAFSQVSQQPLNRWRVNIPCNYGACSDENLALSPVMQ